MSVCDWLAPLGPSAPAVLLTLTTRLLHSVDATLKDAPLGIWILLEKPATCRIACGEPLAVGAGGCAATEGVAEASTAATVAIEKLLIHFLPGGAVSACRSRVDRHLARFELGRTHAQRQVALSSGTQRLRVSLPRRCLQGLHRFATSRMCASGSAGTLYPRWRPKTRRKVNIE